MNWVYDIIEDAVLASLEQNNSLPKDFEVTIDHEAFLELARDRHHDAKIKRLWLQIQGHTVLVRSHLDSEPWLKVLSSEVLH